MMDQFTPLLLEVIDPYLLKQYEHHNNFLVYMPSEKDVDDKYLILVSLENPKNQLKIKNMITDPSYSHIIYNESKQELIVASETEIKYMKIKKDWVTKGVWIIDAAKERLLKIKPTLNLKQLILYTNNLEKGFDILFGFETLDYQLDFNYLIINDPGKGAASITFTFLQYAEIYPRKNKNFDPIEKTVFQVAKEFSYGITKRKSGKIDLYWDFQRKESPRDIRKTYHYYINIVALDVAMSTQTFFIKVFNKDGKNEYLNQYISLQVIGLMVTFVIVAHSQYLSIYDIMTEKWIKHVKFVSEELYSFFQYESSTKQKGLGVLLKNGEVYLLKQNELPHFIYPEEVKFQVQGKIRSCVMDKKSKKFMFIIHENTKYKKKEAELFDQSLNISQILPEDDLKKSQMIEKQTEGKPKEEEEDEFCVTIFIKDGVQRLKRSDLIFVKDDDEEENEEEENTINPQQKQEIPQELKKLNLVPIQSSDPKKSMFLYQKDLNNIAISSIQEQEIDEEKWAQNQMDLIKQDQLLNSTIQVDSNPLQKLQTLLNLNETFDRQKSQILSEKEVQKHYEAQVTVQKVFKNVNEITGIIHSAVIYDNERIFLFDDHNIYLLDIKQHKITNVFLNERCLTIYNFTNTFNYAICNGSKSGLKLYDLQDMINTGICQEIIMKKYDVGKNSFLFYSQQEQRIGFFNGFKHIEVTPILHTNYIKFIGLNHTEFVLAYKVHNGKFTALHENGKLVTWNLVTGKKMFQTSNDSLTWCKDYKVHYAEEGSIESAFDRSGKVLIRSKKEVEIKGDADWQQYYDSWQLQKSLGNNSQTTYSENLSKKIVQWKIIEVIDEKEVKIHYQFQRPLYPFQYVYFNKDHSLMIERQKASKAYLFKRLNKDNNEIIWELVKKLENVDRELESNLLFCVIFSPDFSRYLEQDRKRHMFLIKDTITEQLITEIPPGLMKTRRGENPVTVVNRFQWIDNTTLRLVNKEGSELIIEYFTDKNTKEIGWKEIEFNVIPLFSKRDQKQINICDENEEEEYLHGPYFVNRKLYGFNDIKSSLLQKYQEYKSNYYALGQNDPNQLLQSMFTVDPRRMEFSSQPFTYLNWVQVYNICQGNMKVSELNQNLIQSMFFSIFPGGSSILHLLCESDYVDQMEQLFHFSQPNMNDLTEIKYHIPFLPSFDGLTPMHLAHNQEDFKSINLMLKYLKGYGLDHHSKQIKNLLPTFIKKEVPELVDYLNSRMLQNDQSRNMTKGCLRDQEGPGCVPLLPWFDQEDLEQQMFDKDGFEKRLKCEFVDIPYIYHYKDEDFYNFFDSLAETDEFDYFKIKCIQKLIEFNYSLARSYTVKLLFIPYIFYQLIFMAYANMFYNNYEKIMNDESYDGTSTAYIMEISKYIILLVLSLFSAYFFLNEAQQLKAKKLGYFDSFWNYVDLASPLGVLVLVIMECTASGETTLIKTTESFITLFLWLKFFYFLRIFDNTGYLIRMMLQVITDIKYFIFILCVSLLAFGNTFLVISNANASDDQFVSSLIDSFIYSYKIILGDFDTDSFGTESTGYVMFIFLFCTLLNMIIMLNILIAIICDTFAKVNSNSINAMYQEMSSIISENGYLIPGKKKKGYCVQGQYLMVLTDLEKVQTSEFYDPITDLRDETRSKLDQVIVQNDTLYNKFNQFKHEVNTILKENLINISTILKEKKSKKEKKKQQKKMEKEFSSNLGKMMSKDHTESRRIAVREQKSNLNETKDIIVDFDYFQKKKQ